MLYHFRVGQPCPPVIERPRIDFDGAYLEALPPGGMIALLYLLWRRWKDVRRLWKRARPVGQLVDVDHEKRLRYEQALRKSMVRSVVMSERREA